MVKLLLILAAAVFGIVIGPLSALWTSGLIGAGPPTSFADVEVGGWRSDWAIGSETANPYLRARIARHGLLAMRKEGAVYFIRNTDNEGRPLNGTCRYRLSGAQQDSYWWSITLYDDESMLPRNTDQALSFDASDVAGADPWSATIAPSRPNEGSWISNKGANGFDLTLRLYRPGTSVLENPARHLNPPSVEQLDCEA